jgi:hypothetical protein
MKMQLKRPSPTGGRVRHLDLIQALVKPIHLNKQGSCQTAPSLTAVKYFLQPTAGIRHDAADDSTGYRHVDILGRHLT